MGTHVFNLSSWASRKPSNLTKKTKTPNPRDSSISPSLTRSHPLHAAAAKHRLASRTARPPDLRTRTARPPDLRTHTAGPLLYFTFGEVDLRHISLPSLPVSGPSPFRAAAVAAPIPGVQILPPQPSAASRSRPFLSPARPPSARLPWRRPSPATVLVSIWQDPRY